MKIIIIIIILSIILSIWFVLDKYYLVESYITQEQEDDLKIWFDKATNLKTEISCIE